jgi:uncharacterized protein (DUF486 family)
MPTVALLFFSNVFMTFAWYGHLKYGHEWPLWKAILVSWLIALVEYCLAVPANRHHNLGVHRICNSFSQREARLELRRGFRFSRCRRILRVCF